MDTPGSFSGRSRPQFYLLPLLVSLVFLVKSAHAQIPAGYYNQAAGLNGAPLKTALQKIIRNHTRFSYDYLWTSFVTTDDKPNGKVWDIYSDIPDGTPNGNPPYVFTFVADQCSTTPGVEGVCYNREHSFPKSWFGAVLSDTMYSDMFHLYPTDSKVNSMRNNYPYGQVSAPTFTSMNGSKLGPCVTAGYTGVVFEPRDDFKGDIARSYFYMATRYESRIASWQSNTGADAVLDGTAFPCYDQWFLNLLLAWNEADPVSPKEIDRNNEIYNTYQHNRNPYIDHPEYAAAIWGPAVVKAEPTNHPTNFTAVAGIPSYSSINLTWTDATGAVIPDGYLIKGSVVSFSAITDPVDGTAVGDGGLNKNVGSGLQAYSFTGLAGGSTYFFKIYPFTNSGANINYKTDGLIQQSSATTLVTLSTGIFFSEYIEGSSNNKALEICNGQSSVIDLSKVTVKLYANGGVTPTNTWSGPAGTIDPGATYVLYNSASIPLIIASGNAASTVCNFNGNDALELIYDGQTKDMIGLIGTNPGSSWTIAGNSSATVDKTILRKLNTTDGTTNWAASAGTNAGDSQWVIISTNDYSGNLGSFGTAWRGSTNTSWITGTNWDIDVPQAAVNAIIPDVTTDPVVTSSAEVNNMLIKSGGLLTIAPSVSLTVNGNLINKNGQ